MITEKVNAPSGYVPIHVLSWHKKDSAYFDLSPYYLKTDGDEELVNPGGILFENFWQGSKVYPTVYPIDVYSHPSKTGNQKFLWWSYPRRESHLVNNLVTPDYYKWRSSLWSCPKAIRYPNGREHRHEVAFSLLTKKDGAVERLSYLQARQRIYGQEYKRLIRMSASYQSILTMHNDGKNICIIEIDVPKQSAKGLFKTYSTPDNLFHATPEKVQALIEDPSSSCGHGIFLIQALFEDSGVNLG